MKRNMQSLSTKEVTTGNSDVHSNFLHWACPFEETASYGNESETWYTFLNSLYCAFSKFEIQVNRENYNVVDIDDFGKKNENNHGNLKIDKNNFKQFLNKISLYKIAEHQNVQNITISDSQLEELNHVLQLTIKDRLLISCKDTHVYIKGYYICISKIFNFNLSSSVTVLDHNCRDLHFDKSFFSNFKLSYNIFALNTLFIDDDISSEGNNVTINAIAPKWEIINTKKIDLKGKDGELPEKGYLIDGKPGKPGGNAGNFFGIGKEFINGTNLKIVANGGDGSRGEDGRNGENGRDGSSPTVPYSYNCGFGLCKNSNTIGLFNCEQVYCERIAVPTGYGYGAASELRTYCKYKIFGESGTLGRNGGKGGKAGRGGRPGNNILIELENPSGIFLSNNTGSDGVDGKGGRGGIGGRKGCDIVVYCGICHYSDCKWSLLNTSCTYERAASGKDGRNGENYLGINSEKIADSYKTNAVIIINRYKSYLRENLNERFTHVFLKEFVNILDDNNKIKMLYDATGLIDELQSLEEQFPGLNQDINFLPFYESLLSRVNDYAKTPKMFGNTIEHRKILSYLYTAILSRIHNIEDNLESNLIIDINAYLKTVIGDLDKLKDLKTIKYKVDLINKYKQEYKHKVDLKMEEANELISKEIIPEVENIGMNIDEQMESLINEVIYLQKQAKIEHEKLVSEQQHLQNTLILQGLFSAIRIIGDVISFLVPAGAVAGSIIESSNGIARSFFSENIENLNNVSELPQNVPDIQMRYQQIKTISDQKISYLKNSLECVSLEIQKHPGILGNISANITDISNKLVEIENDGCSLNEILFLENELEIVLLTLTKKPNNIKHHKKVSTKDKRKLKSKDKLTNPKNSTEASTKHYKQRDRKRKTKNKNSGKKQKKVVSNLKGLFRFSSVMPESYTKYKNNKTKLGAIIDAIKQNEETFKQLKIFEQNLYNTFMPMIQNMQNELYKTISNLGTKSEVALDVTKWNVKSTLRDMILLMPSIEHNFTVKGNLARFLEKLEDAMITIMNVHGLILQYQKDQTFANFIADISTAAVTDVNIATGLENQEMFGNSIRDLEITIRSNIVVQRYSVAINSFKQFVFPFAHNYFKDLILPLHLELNDGAKNSTLDSLITKAATEIEKIDSKLEDYINTVTKQDRCIGRGDFRSGYISSKPFFVWKNENNRKMISKLLSGEDVIIKADVRKSEFFQDAIKFNVIEFTFKSRNETVQSEIDNKLKMFQIRATHLGNSYYRYKNKFYEIITPSQKIWYYFEKRNNGEPIYYSLSYSKIKNGNIMLSPYATWKVKLGTVTDKSSFKDLEIYKDEVDLNLEGHGHFINKRIENCDDLMVDNYYKVFDLYNVEKSNIETSAGDNVLKNSSLKKIKREINPEFTTESADADNNNRLSTPEKMDNNTKSYNWFSWFTLPNFNILPGAEATKIDNSGVVTENKNENTTENIFTLVANHVNLLKKLMLSTITKHLSVSSNGILSPKSSGNYTDYITTESVKKLCNHLEVDCNKYDTINEMQKLASIDINSNLALGQLIVNKIYGRNKSFCGMQYISPQIEQNIRIKNLATSILPVINQFGDNYDNDSFIKYYNEAPIWYKKLYKSVFEETVEKSLKNEQ